MSTTVRLWEWRVFWLAESNTSRPPSEAWPSQMAAHLLTFMPGSAKLGSPKQRKDVYVNLGEPNYGLKLRDAESLGERMLELKIRKGNVDGIEDWDKVLCESTSLQPQELTPDAIAVAVGPEHRQRVVDLLESVAERTIVQVDLDKVRVHVDAGIVKMEAVEMNVRRNGGAIWRSVCIEGADLATVRNYVDLPYFVALKRQVPQPIQIGPFEMGYPEFISSVLFSV
jgi:hypothetical protein